MEKLNYLISTSGRFHYFEIAKILHERNQLLKIVSGYPWIKLKREKIPKKFVKSFGIYQIFSHILHRTPYFNLNNIIDYLNILNKKKIDRLTSKYINKAEVFISSATNGLNTGKVIKKNNKIYICDQSSAHILFEDNILAEEYKELNQQRFIKNKWFIDLALQEYEESNIILVPSQYVKRTFEKYYIKKVHAINLAVNLNNFYPMNSIKKDKSYFDILFIGTLSIGKGLHYLINAFEKFKHPKKRLHIVGSHTNDKKFFSNQLKVKNDNIFVYGHMHHFKLKEIINKSDIFVLPSLSDGFATVVIQALACGCPVIVSENTGAADIVRENKCGFVVPIRDSQIIADKLTLFSDNSQLLKEFSNNALKVTKKNSWEDYVDKLDQLVAQLKNSS